MLWLVSTVLLHLHTMSQVNVTQYKPQADWKRVFRILDILRRIRIPGSYTGLRIQIRIWILLFFSSVLWIRIRSDPKMFAESGSGKNHSGSTILLFVSGFSRCQPKISFFSVLLGTRTVLSVGTFTSVIKKRSNQQLKSRFLLFLFADGKIQIPIPKNNYRSRVIKTAVSMVDLWKSPLERKH